MCCAFLSLLLFGPRVVGAFWWLFQPAMWEATFRNWMNPWWIWPMLGIIFVPWTTLMYVIVAPGGLNLWDWIFIGIAVVADVASYGGGVGRKRVPGYQGY
jgi:uncharacterized BrkB/YihY/UPF0761 family membrane protein